VRRKRSRNGAGAGLQFFVREAGLFILAIGKITEEDARAMLGDARAQQFVQIRKRLAVSR
jgi:hypothetical protein